MAFYRRVLGIAVLGSVSLLSGCGNFFSCEGKPSCPTTGGGGTTNTGDLVYVSDSLSGPTYISGYSLASGVLTPISGADMPLGYVPIAMVVAPSNGFLYVASRADAPSPGAGVYVYTISSTGALTLGNNGDPFNTDQGISSMDISPDGNFLFSIGDSSEGVILTEYPLDTTTGLPKPGNPLTFFATGTGASTFGCSILGSATPLSQLCTVKVSPKEDFVAVALAGNGLETFSYSSSGGVTLTPVAPQVFSSSTQPADFSLAFDKNDNLYVASTSALTSFDGLAGTLTQEKTVPFGTGTTDIRPRSVTLSSNSDFVYTANEGSGTISGFSLPGSGVLTSLGTPIVGPANVSVLGIDSTGKYLLAAGYNSTNGLQVFTISSSGALTAAGTPEGTLAYDNSTGSDANPIPIVMALSH